MKPTTAPAYPQPFKSSTINAFEENFENLKQMDIITPQNKTNGVRLRGSLPDYNLNNKFF